MTNFSTKERLIASVLSATPGLKLALKKIYVKVNAFLYQKNYSYKILCNKIIDIKSPLSNLSEESFFGYYDKCSLNKNGWLIVHLTKRRTKKVPSAKENIDISVVNIYSGCICTIASSSSYTWQQGARTQWLTDDLIMYNNYSNNKYQAIVYSLQKKGVVKMFDFPVQDSYSTNYYLSINYQRIMNLRPDYGYRNLPLLTDNEMQDLVHDGIWKIEYETGDSLLLHTLQEITDCRPKSLFKYCLHKINHLMISKNGKGFIFIHRYYQGKRRFDRLMYSDFNTLRVLVDDNMVSHCCWIDDDTVFGYFRYNGAEGYYYCNIHTGIVTPCATMTDLQLGDGHPSCIGNWIVFDTYPDKSRMQHLYLYNRISDQIIPLLELFQDIVYMGESRCDLHPRFSEDGRYVFFDTVFTGKRSLCYIDLKNIL